MSIQKVFTVDKFLGLHESRDGTTELKLGEASRIENFYITDDYNLKSRPGVSIVDRRGVEYLALWQGYIGVHLVRLIVYKITSGVVFVDWTSVDNTAGGGYGSPLYCDPAMPIKIFSIGSKLYVYAAGDGVNRARMESVFSIFCNAEGQLEQWYGGEALYQPIILTGCTPEGSGEMLEPINILSDYVRVQFSSDGSSTVYKFPSTVSALGTVTVDGVEQKIQAYEGEPGNIQYRFETPPPEGVNNVEFLCVINDAEFQQSREQFLQMKHCEAYNGSTDSRIFFYGDGTNICYYTGVPAYGDGLYLPAQYEIAIDASSSAVTGLRRHYTRLMAFKPDGAFSITYEPVTLADGTVTAGFYVRPAHRAVGNEMENQIQTVNNYPRTLCAGSLYEWRHTASYYQDERYAKNISEKIAVTLAAADPKRIVTCDDDVNQTYYMFLNDDRGTVLVNRYQLDVWTMYNGEVFKGVAFAVAHQGEVLFATKDTIYCFDASAAFDASVEEGGENTAIDCVWESGYMAFGADYKRKYSSNLWISMLPETNSNMDITVQTDRRDEYLTKTAGLPLLDFGSLDFSSFSFLRSFAPKIKRIKIKVKKFVYYKLIFRLTHPGARATVLGYDQQVRFSSNVK